MLKDPRRPTLDERIWARRARPTYRSTGRIHVGADIIYGALAQNLLVHPRSILAEVEVTGFRSSAPPNVYRQLDKPLGFGGRHIIIVGQDDRTGIWSKLRRSGSHHRTEFWRTVRITGRRSLDSRTGTLGRTPVAPCAGLGLLPSGPNGTPSGHTDRTPHLHLLGSGAVRQRSVSLHALLRHLSHAGAASGGGAEPATTQVPHGRGRR